MTSHLPTRRRRNRSGSRLCGYRKFLRVATEPLEERVMLYGGVGASNPFPPAIVVGRTLSSYTAGGIQNNQETITYTVYNEQADPETGILLTDTLSPGETITSASQQPDQSGQNLAWSLGMIQGYDRASVTLTLNLPSPTPLQLDAGARRSPPSTPAPCRTSRPPRRYAWAPSIPPPTPMGMSRHSTRTSTRKGSVHVTAESSPIPW